MSADLREQLDRLAGEADVGGPAAPPADLWRRGVRRHRRRFAGATALAVLAIAVVGGGTGLLWDRLASTYEPGPVAQPKSRLAIPTRIETVSPWLPDTGSKGPIGPLAVVAGAERRTGLLGTSHNGVVGISAKDGTYRFLDLPRRAEGLQGIFDADAVALSTGGRWVAYWYTGPIKSKGDAPRTGVVGAGVLDTVTGELRQTRFDAPLGLQPVRLEFLDDRRLLLQYSKVYELTANSASSNQAPLLEWIPGESDPQPVATPGLENVGELRADANGLSSLNGNRLTRWSAGLRPLHTNRLVGLSKQANVLADGLMVSPDGRHVAVAVDTNGSTAGQLLVGDLEGSGDVTMRRIAPDVTPAAILGWRDDGHVVVDSQTRTGREAVTVDVQDQTSEKALSLGTVNWVPGTSFASSLWSQDLAERPAPPSITDPRLVGLGSALAVGVVIGALVVWRRRAVR